MSDMIERVALATCSSKPCICKHRAGFEDMPCLERGRRGIEAMQEPTREMVDAGYVAEPDGAHVVHYGGVFAAMIDEALK